MSQAYHVDRRPFAEYSRPVKPHGKAENHVLRPVPHDGSYYAKCLMGGALSSSIRWIKTPLDAVKCNMQVNPKLFPTFSSGLRRLWMEDGLRGLFRGVGPTVLSYGFQSGTKYGLYEVFKDKFSVMAGEDTAVKYRSLIYMASAGCAEAIGDVLMCPWEMLKVKVQTSPFGTFPTRTYPALIYMLQNHKDMRFPFGALGPLWARQLPGTMANFLCFEYTVESIYTNILTKPKDTYDRTTQLLVTFTGGYVAGLVSTLVSHPADSLVSLQAKPKFSGMTLMQIVNQVGFWKLMTKGLVPRVAMTGSVIACQWITYDAFKSAMGMGTTGGKHS